MEGKDSKITAAEFDVMDEIYFVTPYQEVLQNSGLKEELLKDVLKQLLNKKYIWQMRYSNSLKDFEKMEVPDHEHLEQFNYLASKEGLLAHNI